MSLVILTVEVLGMFNLFVWWAVVGLGFVGVVLCGWLILWKKRFVVSEGESVDLKSFIVLLLMSGLAFMVVFFNGLSPMSEIDSVGYHLPIMSNFIRTGGVWDVFHAGFVGPNTFFPANHEALQSFLTMFVGDINLNFIVTLLGVILFYVALVDFARGRKLASFFAVLGVVSVPFLFGQFLNVQVDLFLFSLFGASVVMILSSILNNDKGELAKAFLVLGLVVGTKYNGLPQVVILIPLVVAAFWHFRKSFKGVIWMPLLALATGSFWYIRNWIVAGNPLYPFGIDLGFLKFEGHKSFMNDFVDTSILHHINIDGVKSVVGSILNHPGFGGCVGEVYLWIFPFVLGVAAIAAISVLSRKKKGEWRCGLLFLTMLLYLFVAEVFYYINSPYSFTLWSQTIRYAAPIFALLPIFMVVSAYYSKLSSWLVVLGGAGLFAYNFLFNSFLVDGAFLNLVGKKLNMIGMWPVLGMIALLGLVLWLVWLAVHARKWWVAVMALLLVGVSSFVYQFPENTEFDDEFIASKSEEYKEMLAHLEILRERLVDGFEKIALSGILPYWFFEREGYEPVYVNIDGCVECKYFDYRNEEKSVRAHPDAEKWKAALKEMDVKYLLINSAKYSGRVYMYEEDWAKSDKEMFHLLLRTDSFRLYEIIF